jgi:putative SOS response-associated peptidase YedK
MCGRYAQTSPADALAKLFGVGGPLPNLGARFNIAPTQQAPVLRMDDGARALASLRWGLVPPWAKTLGDGPVLINARAETVAEKPAFRDAFRARRCLVPADGFYEWQIMGRVKQPWRIHRADGGPFAFAGLWERWDDPSGGAVESFTIITTKANAKLTPIHHRMPVILMPDGFAAWLTGGRAAASALMRPLPDDALDFHPVSTRVNSVANDDASLIDRAEPMRENPPAQADLFG